MHSAWLKVLAIFGLLAMGFGACLFGIVDTVRTFAPSKAERALSLPLPHHFSKYPDGVSLRFAMVHDVIHERFPWHGPAYYEERNRVVRGQLTPEEEKLARGEKPSPTYFTLLDDLGVGLDRLGKHQDAIALIRDKLDKQQALGLSGKDLYSSYANLGTFLILWQLQEGFADVPTAKQRLTEGLEYVHKSIEVNPEAHFGREIWQAVILEYILAVLDNPELVLKYDMVGNRLDKVVDPNPAVSRCIKEGRAWQYEARYGSHELKRKNSPEERAKANLNYREFITLVGAEEGWAEEVKTSQTKPVPFDEPALGIVGMWRLGGGANPHFALALAEIMLRVGQRHIAWCGYERASMMAGGLGAEPIAQKFREHCRARQAVIEAQLPAAELAKLKTDFPKELAFGQRYQKDYQDYEARQIAAGVSIDDPHFYDVFEAEHGPIASPVGEEDQFVVEDDTIRPRQFIPWQTGLFFAGLFTLLLTIVVKYALNRKRSPGSPTVPMNG